MNNCRVDAVDFADTVPMPAWELPGAAVRVALPPAIEPRAAAIAAELVALAGPAPAPEQVAPFQPAAPMRRATDFGAGLIARFSLHRRRATDAKRGAGPAAATPAPTAPSALTASEPAAPPPALRLFVRGFNDAEKRLLEGTVRLSQRRVPRLSLVPEVSATEADLVLIDGSDAEAVAWAESRPWLADKNAIWIDSRLPRPGHTESQRPVQWPLLPMLLARALERGAVRSASAPTRRASAPTAPTAPSRRAAACWSSTTAWRCATTCDRCSSRAGCKSSKPPASATRWPPSRRSTSTAC
jgi:hypothetical protein